MNLKGSYTVEAAIVISLCFLIFCSAICLSYKLFENAVEYVSYKPSGFDPVSLFRHKEGAVGVFHAILD